MNGDKTNLGGFRPRRDLLPFLIAATILFLIARGKDWEAVTAALAGVNLPLFLVGAGGYVLCYYLVTAFCYGLAYGFFVPGIRLRKLYTAFGASLLPQAVFPSLGQGLFLLYMVKKQRVSLFKALGVHVFIMVNDLGVMAAVVGLALFLLPEPPKIFILWFGLLALGLALTLIYARLGGRLLLFPRLHASNFMLALRTGSARQFGGFFAARLGWQAMQIFFHSLALAAIGITAPLGMTGVLVLLMSLTSVLPIAALGFGGPNLVAEFFAPWVAAGKSPSETAFAYGLLFQTVFLAGRLVIGIIFALPIWREIFRPDASLQSK